MCSPPSALQLGKMSRNESPSKFSVKIWYVISSNWAVFLKGEVHGLIDKVTQLLESGRKNYAYILGNCVSFTVTIFEHEICFFLKFDEADNGLSLMALSCADVASDPTLHGKTSHFLHQLWPPVQYWYRGNCYSGMVSELLCSQ